MEINPTFSLFLLIIRFWRVDKRKLWVNKRKLIADNNKPLKKKWKMFIVRGCADDEFS